MIIRYFDKNGKEHRMSLDRPFYISSKHNVSGKTIEYKLEEIKEYNVDTQEYETCGKFNLSSASGQGISISLPMLGGNSLKIGPERS